MSLERNAALPLVEPVNGQELEKAAVLNALVRFGALGLTHFLLLSWNATHMDPL